jgi:hypothetical protein
MKIKTTKYDYSLLLYAQILHMYICGSNELLESEAQQIYSVLKERLENWSPSLNTTVEEYDSLVRFLVKKVCSDFMKHNGKLIY